MKYRLSKLTYSNQLHNGSHYSEFVFGPTSPSAPARSSASRAYTQADAARGIYLVLVTTDSPAAVRQWYASFCNSQSEHKLAAELEQEFSSSEVVPMHHPLAHGYIGIRCQLSIDLAARRGWRGWAPVAAAAAALPPAGVPALLSPPTQ
jgi:hypothetical protein